MFERFDISTCWPVNWRNRGGHPPRRQVHKLEEQARELLSLTRAHEVDVSLEPDGLSEDKDQAHIDQCIQTAFDLRQVRSYNLIRDLLGPVPAYLQRRLQVDDLEPTARQVLRRSLEWSLETLAVGALHDRRPPDPAEVSILAEQLQQTKPHFTNLARRLLWVRIWTWRDVAGGVTLAESLCEHDRPLYLHIRAQLALCTALASDLPADYRLDSALQILQPPVPDNPRVDFFEADFETLRRAALIYKRRWLRALNKSDIERASAYYLAAYDKATANGNSIDALSVGVEATYLIDQLAFLDENEFSKDFATRRRVQADALRTKILTMVQDTDWVDDFSSLINLAHLHFGLSDTSRTDASHHLEQAEGLLQRARQDKTVSGWEKDRAAQELIDRARYREKFDADSARQRLNALQGFLSKADSGRERQHTLQAAALGKVGLALSGGGFRAALFHLGVLARLAELDLLRHVEVLSCVSGGSVVGAHYYLKLRHLLQTEPTEALHRRTAERLRREDYIQLVEELIEEFLAGVQKNIRTRVITNPWKNLKMMLPGAYSRTDRAAELFERHLFSRVQDDHIEGDRRPKWRQKLWPKRRRLQDLKVAPWDSREAKPNDQFNPGIDNWKRDDKVPMLILNATSLNTGHNWQFTVTWMGESPAAIDVTVDTNERLRRMYLAWEAPAPHDKTSLGVATAASACVPGLFDPATLDGLYADKGVRLVDGGVFDNQGVASLVAEDCKVVLVSDASGQMDSQDNPGGGFLQVPLRSNAILMERIRQTQYRDLAARRRGQLLRGFLFLHLKKDLKGQTIDWIGCDDPKASHGLSTVTPKERWRFRPWRVTPPAVSIEPEPNRKTEPETELKTDYGIVARIQSKLADIRTDLDSFCDIEAYALMYSGYRMACHDTKHDAALDELAPWYKEQAHNIERARGWVFLAVERWMTGLPPADEAERAFYRRAENVLRVGKQRMFKVWYLHKWMFPLFLALALVSVGTVFHLDLLQLLPEISHESVKLLSRDVTIPSAVVMFTALALPVLVLLLMLFPRFNEKLGSFVQMSVLGTLGMLLAGLHLAIFDRLFLSYGRIEPMRGTTGNQDKEPATQSVEFEDGMAFEQEGRHGRSTCKTG